MGWPKGMPRKGHVNKDGSTHAKRGSKLRAAHKTRMVATNAHQEAPAQRQADKAPKAWTVKPEWKSLLRWTGDKPPWTAFCPACTFPEADGGYCPACGWTTKVEYGKRVA